MQLRSFFSAWRWKGYERNPQAQLPLIQAMEEACGDIAPELFQGWIRHTRRYFPHCLARENIACDVDEVLWPDRNQRQDEAYFFCPFLFDIFLSFFVDCTGLYPIVCSVQIIYTFSCVCCDVKATALLGKKKNVLVFTVYLCVFYI